VKYRKVGMRRHGRMRRRGGTRTGTGTRSRKGTRTRARTSERRNVCVWAKAVGTRLRAGNRKGVCKNIGGRMQGVIREDVTVHRTRDSSIPHR
jgi:hypothetical protein